MCVVQPPELVDQRKIKRNLCLAATRKITLLADILSSSGIDVSVFSDAYPAERSGRFYHSIKTAIGGTNTLCFCAAGFDIRYLAIPFGLISLLLTLFKEHNRKPFDAVIVYNYGLIQSLYILIAKYIMKCRIILEYEDDATIGRYGEATVYNRLSKWGMGSTKKYIGACFAVSHRLLSQIAAQREFLLPGIVENEITRPVIPYNERARIFIYSGALQPDKGVDRMIAAWLQWEDRHDWQLHITGDGPLRQLILDSAATDPSIYYHGCVDRNILEDLLGTARFGLNPHRLSYVAGNVIPFKLVEYLYHEMPVLSTPLGGIDEHLTPGLIIVKDDSIESLLAGFSNAASSSNIDLKTVVKHIAESYTVAALRSKMKTLVS